MSKLTDITNDPKWIDEQLDRLLAFEVLHMAATMRQTPLTPAELGDKIGIHKGFSHQVIENIRNALK